MSNVVTCPRCGQANRVPEPAEGKKAVCGKCHQPLDGAAGKPFAVTDASFRAAIAEGAVVVDFWASWCGPCRVIAPVVEQLAAERADVRFAKLDVDANPATSAAFNVSGIPTLIFFRDGQERGRVVGAVGKAQLEQAITRYLT